MSSETANPSTRATFPKMSSALPPSTTTPPVAEDPVAEHARRMIAQHGLDDATWAKAISAQYFLVLIGRRLRMTGQSDYLKLMDRFVGSFTYRVNDRIELNPDRVLVTPEETEGIRAAMDAEDGRDSYFAKSRKTASGYIDTDLLHLNYLYGLTLQIASAPPRTSILKALEDAALDHLIHETNGPTLDEYGGWVPYRIPWVTARILTSMSHVDLSARSDARLILDCVDTGLRSLMDRVTDDGLWRSGVGHWVSKWESSGLCLEALYRWQSRLTYPQQKLLEESATAILNRQSEWTRPPNLDTEDRANDTLAGVVLASLLHEKSRQADEVDHQRLRSYLEDALAALSKYEATPRQF